MTELAGRKVVVVGLGASGRAAALALLAQGAHVTVVDDADGPELRARAHELVGAGAAVEVGGHHGALHAHDLAVVSPGVPPFAPVLEHLRSAGTEMWSEIELAYRMADCSFLAVTGTNGKTTVTSLLAAMLRAGGIPSIAAGNIGHPLSTAVADVPPHGAVAVEASSFQLASIRTFRPRVAVVLNVAEDHTDWHGSMEAYAAAKARIFENQTGSDVAVLNADDAVTASLAARAPARVVWFSATTPRPGGYCADSGHLVRDGEPFIARDAVGLGGLHGLEDALAATAAAAEFGVPAAAIERALRDFRPGPHRMEVVGVVDGVTYIDDSKATNPHACLAALRGSRNVVLIAGGRSKGIDLSVLHEGAPSLRGVVALGEARDEIAEVFRGTLPVQKVSEMSAAVDAARAMAVAGGSVLLSPACASLDMYGSYAERGADFARCVAELAREAS